MKTLLSCIIASLLMCTLAHGATVKPAGGVDSAALAGAVSDAITGGEVDAVFSTISYGSQWNVNVPLSMPVGWDIPSGAFGDGKFLWKKATTTLGAAAEYIRSGTAISTDAGSPVGTVTLDAFVPLYDDTVVQFITDYFTSTGTGAPQFITQSATEKYLSQPPPADGNFLSISSPLDGTHAYNLSTWAKRSAATATSTGVLVHIFEIHGVNGSSQVSRFALREQDISGSYLILSYRLYSGTVANIILDGELTVPGDIESIPFSATLDDMHINIVVTETTMTMYINGKNPMKSYNVAPWSNGSLLLDVAGGDVQTFADWGGTSLNLTVVSAASAAGSYTSPPWYYKSFMILDEGEY